MSRPGLTIFVIFFGLSFLDAVRNGPWVRVVLWAVLALAFAGLDLMRGRRRGARRLR